MDKFNFDVKNIENLVSMVIGWFTTLGAGGTLLVLRFAGKLTRGMFKLLFLIFVLGLIYLILTGYINISPIVDYFRK